MLLPINELLNYVYEIKRYILLPDRSADNLVADLEILSELPFSVDIAKKTSITLIVRELSKQSPQTAATRAAAELTKKWKAAYKSSQEQPSSAVPIENIKTWRDLYNYSEREEIDRFEKVTARLSEKANLLRATRPSAISVTPTTNTHHPNTDHTKKRRLNTSNPSASLPCAIAPYIPTVPLHKIPKKTPPPPP
jgi:hypothetical protein